MTVTDAAGAAGDAAWGTALWAARLLALDPGLGGIWLRAGAGPAREEFVGAALAASGRPAARMPMGAEPARLFGGLDLTATLRAGRPVQAAGLLATLGCGTLVVPMAERMTPGLAAQLAQRWDAGAGFALLALDEGEADEPGPPPALTDRLAFHLTLPPRALRDGPTPRPAPPSQAERARLGSVGMPDEMLMALTEIAATLGVATLRAPLLALRAARAIAALEDKPAVDAAAAERAAALVLAPRATRLPAEPDQPQQSDPPPPAEAEDRDNQAAPGDAEAMADRVLEAALASIPPDVLARLAAQGAARAQVQAQGGGAGEDRRGAGRGRPAGSVRGDPRRGARLDLIGTLTAAAPWQALRRGAHQGRDDGRILVTPDDLRIRRHRQRVERVVIFAVDASGSAAMARLAETKGAVELMLAEAYVRREQVALIAFRGTAADLLLPPTRSLVQAKRRLQGLPGGGGTPLAIGIAAALSLADQVTRRGQRAHVALLTDGRANVARDGSPGRPQAQADAQAAARALRAARVPAMVIDTGLRPDRAARDLAAAMDGLYLALPRADARALSGALRGALDGSGA
ncbi:MAG: magnesium chelatase subunit D [Pseudomonadota bacterium]